MLTLSVIMHCGSSAADLSMLTLIVVMHCVSSAVILILAKLGLD